MTTTAVQLAKAQVVAAARAASASGLVVGSAGNISARAGDLIVVTPSGVPLAQTEERDLVVVDLNGRAVDGELVPTSELSMHLEVYRLEAVNGEPVAGIVHTHAPHATAVSTLVETVPSIHYALATCGRDILVAPYHTFGTIELARAAARAMSHASACLLANHGTLACGPDLPTAITRTEVLEWTCGVWLQAKAAGEPRLISPTELDDVITRLATYGQPSSEPTPKP